MRKTLSITIKNEPGALTRITTAFSSGGFNVESIAVGTTQNSLISKMIIVIPGDYEIIKQITKDLMNLIQVLEVKDITDQPCVERELMLIKVKSSPKTRSEILEISNIFRSKIVDISNTSMTLEVVGDPGKILTIQKLLENYTILEIIRTGKIAIERELGINTESLKNESFFKDS